MTAQIAGRDWTADPRAQELLADCAARLPTTYTESGLGLGGMEYARRYSNHDTRVFDLKVVRKRIVGDDPAAHFAQPTIEQAIYAQSAMGFERAPCGAIHLNEDSPSLSGGGRFEEGLAA